MSRKEDNIKKYLNSLANQEQFVELSNNFGRTLAHLNKSKDGRSIFHQLSDWNDSREIMGLESASLPKLIRVDEKTRNLVN